LARALADDVAVLVNGRIVIAGPQKELLDGVSDGSTFLWSVEMRDHSGPRHLEGARLLIPRERTRAPEDTTINPWFTVVGLVVVVVLVAAAVGALR
jgi:hypothetical protein